MAKFTKRQQQVIDLLVQGINNRGMAKILNIGERTAKAYVSHIGMRMNLPLTNRVKIATFFYRQRHASPTATTIAECPVKFPPHLLKTVELVCKGLTNREISVILGTTEQVIKNYLRRIYDLTGTWDRLEVAIWYCRWLSTEQYDPNEEAIHAS